MLAGEPPFTGPTAQAMLARRFTETPRPLREVRETVPEAVERAVAQGAGQVAGGPVRAARRSSRGRWPSGRRAAERAEPRARRADGARRRRAATIAQPARRRAAPLPGHRRARRSASCSGWACCSAGSARTARRRHGRRAPSGWRCCRSRTWAPPTTSTSPTASPTRCAASWPRCRDSRSPRGAARASTSRPTKTPQEIGRELGVDYLLTGTVRWEKGGGGQAGCG